MKTGDKVEALYAGTYYPARLAMHIHAQRHAPEGFMIVWDQTPAHVPGHNHPAYTQWKPLTELRPLNPAPPAGRPRPGRTLPTTN